MTNYNRIFSIDIFRGILLFLMIYIMIPAGELFPDILPGECFRGNFIESNACWIFSGFLFLAGISIPFSLSRRFSGADIKQEVNRHIFLRFISLLIIGVLMLNITRADSELTGMSNNLWAVVMYAGIILVWNEYPEKENNFFTVTGLKLTGMAILAFLVFKFKSGEPENNGSLITGWWGFAGIIGWSYLVAAFTYFFFRNSIIKTSAITLLFMTLCVLSDFNKITVPYFADSLFQVIIDGVAPFIMLSGLLTGLVIKNFQQESRKIFYLSGLMIVYIFSGFILLKTSLLPVYLETTGFGLLTTGLSLLIFIPLYYLADIMKLTGWAGFLRPAGENPLTTYLASGMIFYLISFSGLDLFFFRKSGNIFISAGGSLIYAFLMVQLTALLVRLNIRPKV